MTAVEQQSGLIEQEDEILDTVIELNVGGKHFYTTNTTLTKFADSKLASIFGSSKIRLPRDAQGRYFIDRPSSQFESVLDWLRTDHIIIPVSRQERRKLWIEIDYYGFGKQLQTKFSFLDSSLINEEQRKLLLQWLEPTANGATSSNANSGYATPTSGANSPAILRSPSLLATAVSNSLTLSTNNNNSNGQQQQQSRRGPRTQPWELCYKASRDGFRAYDFHRRCNNIGETLTLIQTTNGFLFGGYTGVSWGSREASVSDRDAFIFSFNNPHLQQPIRMVIGSNSSNSNDVGVIYDYGHYGPTFGRNGAIYIHVCDNSNQSNSSYTNIGTTAASASASASATPTTPTTPKRDSISWNNTLGASDSGFVWVSNGSTFLSGERYFVVKEIEVFCTRK